MIEPFIKKLSKREQEVSDLVSLGLSNKEVADKLFVIEKTVKFHLTNIFRKLRIRNRIQLIVLNAQKNKIAPEVFFSNLKAKVLDKEVKKTDLDAILPKGKENDPI